MEPVLEQESLGPLKILSCSTNVRSLSNFVVSVTNTDIRSLSGTETTSELFQEGQGNDIAIASMFLHALTISGLQGALG